MGMFVNGMLGGYGALLSELYPTEARATAENVLFNLGRGVGGFGPVVVGALVVSYSFTVAIALLATIYLIDIVATLVADSRREGPAAGIGCAGGTPPFTHPPQSRPPDVLNFRLAAFEVGWGFVMRVLRPLVAAIAAVVCSRAARLRQTPHRDRQVGAAHDRLAGRRAALHSGRCRPGSAATTRRAASSRRSAWRRTTSAASGTTRRCRTRSSSPRAATPSTAPSTPATSGGRRRTAACGSSPRTRARCSTWSSRRAWPTSASCCSAPTPVGGGPAMVRRAPQYDARPSPMLGDAPRPVARVRLLRARGSARPPCSRAPPPPPRYFGRRHYGWD